MKYIVAYIKILVLVVLTGITFTSCKKEGDIIVVVPLANLNTVNANNYPINIYQNGTRLNNLGSIGTGGQSGFFAVAAGAKSYQLKRASADSPEYLINDYPLTLDSGKVYSLFVAGETADRLFVITEDDTVPISTTQATIRFVNTLPGSVNLDVTIGSANISNIPFKSNTGFGLVNAGANNLKIYQAGSATPVIDQTITLTANTIYTVFTTGTLTGTGVDKLTARMILN